MNMKDYKKLSEMIYKRKSVRAFSKKPADILDNDIDLIKTFELTPLIDNIKVLIKVLKKSEVKNDRSNYCIAFYTEDKPLSLENIGFLGQQLELELQLKGLGTCWWGMKKPKKDYKKIDSMECVITMTVGYPQKEESRVYPDGFSRKPAKDIMIGNKESDKFIEAVRIAPSAVNLQPWLIEKINKQYDFYLRPPKTIIEKMIPDMRRIDMGIAMAHMFVQAKADNLNVSFKFEGKDTKFGKFTGSIIIT